MNNLTDKTIRALKPTDKIYKKHDGDGLHLLVRPTGRKIWKVKLKVNNKEICQKIGEYPKMRISDARMKRDELKKVIRQGPYSKDLIYPAQRLFKSVAEEWFMTKQKGHVEKHKTRTLRYLEKELFPNLGTKPINAITSYELVVLLKSIEKQGTTDKAIRVRTVLRQIFNFAKAYSLVEFNPASDIQEALGHHKVRHYSAITEPKEVGKLMSDISQYSGTSIVRKLLYISPLLMCRPGEVRLLEWVDVHLDKQYLLIPKEKMKMSQDHIIPLSTQALEIIESMESYRINHGCQYVFPSPVNIDQPVSGNTVNRALRSMGYDKKTLTAHGFRAMARTMLDEILQYPVDCIEHQLAHMVRDVNGRAYNRTKHLKKRRMMMQDWSDYLEWLEINFDTTGVDLNDFTTEHI